MTAFPGFNLISAGLGSAVLLALAVNCASALLPDGYVQVSGSQFVMSGNPSHTFKAKGFNYFPQRHPWAIFSEWDPAEVHAELAIAKDMNSNVIRTFIAGGTKPSQATIDAVVEFVQICKAHNQKAIISLFDGYSGFPAAGTTEEAANLALIDAVCGALRNDTGVFAWDVKNEPDWISNEYWSWSLPGAEAEGARRIDWLYRMRNRIKQAAPNHLVTVGLIFNYNNYRPSNTRTIESFVDFVCYHYYPRNYPFETFQQSIQSLKAHTSKPINVEEIGHNAYGGVGATEQDQASLFAQWLATIEQEDISGLVQWTLCDWWDQWPGPIDERYYGFIRADGNYSWKPAAFVYRDNFVVEQFGLPLETGVLSGTVRGEGGEAVPGAAILANPGTYQKTTAIDGSFAILNIVPSTYTVEISAVGYVPQTKTDIVVGPGQHVQIEVVLEPQEAAGLAMVNPGFEMGSLEGWTPWGQVDGAQTGPWFAGLTPRSGTYFLGTATNYGSKSGGVFQQAPVSPGKSYTFQTWSRTYRDGGSAGSVANRIGIDPTGGTDPDSTAIVWTPFKEYPSGWARMYVSATAVGPRVTVFLQHAQPSDGVWHINCFDDCALYVGGASIGESARLPDGWPVSVSGIISAVFGSSSYYVQDPSRCSGIRVNGSAPAQQGASMRVYGRLGTLTGERFVIPDAADLTGLGSRPIEPLQIRAAAVGGITPTDVPGIPGAHGLYNSGLLVTVTGRVTWSSPAASVFYLDDGSGPLDASGQTGIRVIAQSDWIPPVGSFASVTGISTRMYVSGAPARVLRMRSAQDCVTH